MIDHFQSREMFRSIYFIGCLIVAAAAQCAAQISTAEQWRFGITGSGTLNMHSGELTTFDGLRECGTFSQTNSLGWTAGNAMWYRLDQTLALSARLQYWNGDGTFTSPNPVQPLVALSSGAVVPLQTDYVLTTANDYLTLDVLAQWYLVKDWYVGIGPQIGVPMRTSFEQREKIVQPAFMEFVNGGTERTIYAADFASNDVSTRLRLAVVAGIGTDIHVAPRFVVSPEVSYAFALTTVLSGSAWNIHAVRAGLQLSYAFGEPEPPAIKAAEPVPPPSAPRLAVAETVPPLPTVAVDIESTQSDGTVVPGGDVFMIEQRSYDVVPLLPFVFFEAQQSVIPQRYARGATPGFNEAMLYDSVIGIYHQLLNIVGSRMNRFPETRLSITGYREPADNENDAAIATARALTVRAYLQQHWKIDASRLDVASGILPPIVSNRGIDDGRSENRRVELASTDARILAPISRTERNSTIEPRVVRIIPAISHRDQVTSLGGEVISDDGTKVGNATQRGEAFEWIPQEEDMQRILGQRRSARLTAQVSVASVQGEQRTASAPIVLRREIRSKRYSNDVVNDSTIERFRWIFFDYDAATVSAFNASMVELVRSRIRTSSALRITGFTDRIGPSERNQQLSLARAHAIDAQIKKRIVPERVDIRGVGPELIYNNDLPEGRWYNRTVLIEVATPVDAE